MRFLCQHNLGITMQDLRVSIMSHRHHCNCHNSSAAQSLDELDFERGIWYAAQHGDLVRVKKLIGDVNRRDAAGYSALHYASRNGKLDVCKFLLENGADVNAVTNGGATALSRAAMVGDKKMVEFLLNKKGDPFIKDSDGKTALHRAYDNGHKDICKILIEFAPGLKEIADSKGNKIESF